MIIALSWWRSSITSLILLCMLPFAAAKEWNFELSYAPGPPDNPLKGLVPYAGDQKDRFPHSMEFSYLPLDKVVVGQNQYDWAPLDQLLNAVSGRGHHTIFRFFMEYPGKPPAIPKHLLKQGVKQHSWLFQDKHTIITPDYSDPRVRDMLADFIAALGKRYDGDARIGFIHAGLLGLWGEWHNWPRKDLFAPKETQIAVLDAYEKAFPRTRILLRYPAGFSDPIHAANSTRPFGYHDDSFAWTTLDTGRRQDNWYFIPLLRAAKATNKWRTQPIGGEIRPEAWGKVFDTNPRNKRIQDFEQCVIATRASWLMDSGMFRIPAEEQPPGRIANALSLVAKLGYDLYVSHARVQLGEANNLRLLLTIANRGVAPFYEPWSTQYALLDDSRKILKLPSKNQLNGILPGAEPMVWKEQWQVGKIPPGRYTLLMRGLNPLPNGSPVRFANTTQDSERNGWLSLGQIQL